MSRAGMTGSNDLDQTSRKAGSPTRPEREPMSASGADALRAEVAGLRAELHTLNTHRYIRIHNSYWQMIGFQFLRGLATGLGTVVGATVIVSVLGYSLGHIDFIPIIGAWAAEIADQIKLNR